MTVIASELFSAEVPGGVLAGELDIGLALHPEPMTGISTEALRVEPLAALLSKRHRLGHAKSIPLPDLEHETLLLFPASSLPPTTTASSRHASGRASSLRSERSPNRPSTQCSHDSSGHTTLDWSQPRSPSTSPRPSQASSPARSSIHKSWRSGRSSRPRAPNRQQSNGSSRAHGGAPLTTAGSPRKTQQPPLKPTRLRRGRAERPAIWAKSTPLPKSPRTELQTALLRAESRRPSVATRRLSWTSLDSTILLSGDCCFAWRKRACGACQVARSDVVPCGRRSGR